MSDIAEIKSLFEATQRTAEAAKQKAEEIEGKSKDYVDQDTLSKIKGDLATKFSALAAANAELKTRLEEAETKLNRPGAAKGQNAETKAFDNYLRKGAEASELKAMSTGTQADGGFAIPVTMRDGIQARLRRSSPVRSVASVVQIEGNTFNILVDRADTGFEWAGEVSTRTETDTPTINRISITTHELSALPKVSQRMLDEAMFDVEGYLSGKIGERFARAEATAFVSGNGVDKPKGFLAYSMATGDDASRAAETLQYRPTGAAGAFASAGADVLVRTFYDLQAPYQANATWMMKNTTMAEVATLKDVSGAYLLQSMLNTDGTLLQTIMGRPAVQADDMPAIGAGANAIAVGDFTAGYTIVDGVNVTILRDPFSAKPNVLFYATKRVGGGVSDFDAIKLIRFATT